ncbi:MAG: isoprenylcysteine carboxylmethyltransferase family protein [Chitinophagaceae bacterium]
MVQHHIILALGWIVFCVMHSVFASIRIKNKIQGLLKNHHVYYRFYYTIFALITFVALLYYQVTIYSPLLYSHSGISLIAGGIVSVVGAVIMIICIKKYFMRLTGLRSIITNDKKTSELIITGIHKHVRHPLYLGTFIFIWGLFIIMPYLSLLISNIIITVYTLIGIGFEEKKLEEEFGESYKAYKKQVPKILPFNFIR